MTGQIITAKGEIYPGGVTVLKDGSLNIAVPISGSKCGIIFYGKDKEQKVIFDSSFRIGKLYCVHIEGVDIFEYTKYRLFQDKF